MLRHFERLAVLLLLAVLTACGDDPGGDAPDAGSDSSGDAAQDPSSDTVRDATTDTQPDGAPDADPDTGAPTTLAVDPSDAVPDALAGFLQEALDLGRLDTGAPGAAFAIWIDGVGYWEGGSGLQDTAQEIAMTGDTRGRIGSCTKSFAAALILQLVDEGMLGLDDPISTWYPDFPNAENITVRHLSTHTSGIFNYTNDLSTWGNRDEPTTIDALLAVAEEMGPDFAPGEGWNYSNTGYYLLGDIFEQVSGEDWSTALHARILDPLGLDTIASPSGDGMQTEISRGYDGSGNDVTYAVHPSMAWSAGELVSSPRDMVRWNAAVFSGDAYDQSHVDYMRSEAPQVDASQPEAGRYAHGFAWVPMAGFGGEAFTHSGGIDGFISQMAYLPAQRVIVAGWVNTGTPEEPGTSGIVRRLVEVALDW